jgi:hypothetical protein
MPVGGILTMMRFRHPPKADPVTQGMYNDARVSADVRRGARFVAGFCVDRQPGKSVLS